jgi:hypothetical protein
MAIPVGTERVEEIRLARGVRPDDEYALAEVDLDAFEILQ